MLAILLGVAMALGMTVAVSAPAQAAVYPFCYQVHAYGIGWMDYKCDGHQAGTVGQNRQLEAVRLNQWGSNGVAIQCHVATVGWQPWNYDGACGTTGLGLALEAVRIHSTQQVIRCQVHVGGIGWMPSTTINNETCGTVGQGRHIEAIRFWIG